MIHVKSTRSKKKQNQNPGVAFTHNVLICVVICVDLGGSFTHPQEVIVLAQQNSRGVFVQSSGAATPLQRPAIPAQHNIYQNTEISCRFPHFLCHPTSYIFWASKKMLSHDKIYLNISCVSYPFKHIFQVIDFKNVFKSDIVGHCCNLCLITFFSYPLELPFKVTMALITVIVWHLESTAPRFQLF